MTIRAIISRAEAKAQGLGRYFTGIPCSRGHIEERQVSWGRCAACNRENVRRKAETPAGQENQLKRSLKWRAPSVDHKTPLSRKGSNWPDNIQLLCLPCNISKGTKTIDEWVAWRAAA